MRAAFGVFTILVMTLVSRATAQAPGLRPGDEVSAWEPVHVAGPHAGTKTCPVCTYLDAPFLLAFAKDERTAKEMVKPLEAIATTHAKGKLRVLLLVADGSEEQLKSLAIDQGVRHLMLCRPDPERKEKQLKVYKIDLAKKSTAILYQNYVVTKTWNGLTASDMRSLKDITDSYLPKR